LITLLKRQVACCAAMPLRRCTVDLPILRRRESPTTVEEQAVSTHQQPDSSTTPRRSARSTKGEGWPEQIRRFFTVKTANDLNEESDLESSHIVTVENEMVQLMLSDSKLVESRVLGALKSQETRIEGMNKELEKRGFRVEELEKENSRRKEQVLRMKSLIQPLRDEVLRQKTVIDENIMVMSKRVNEMDAMKEEIIAKDAQLEEQSKLITSLQVDEARQATKEQLEIGEEWSEILAEKKKLKTERAELEAVQEANKAKVRELENKVKEMAGIEFKLKFENARSGRLLAEAEKNARELKVEIMEKKATAATLRGQLETKTAECEKLSETKENLSKFEELLANVKSDCRKVKKDNERYEEKLEKKRKDISRLKKKLATREKEKEVSGSNGRAEEVLQENQVADTCASETDENNKEHSERKRKIVAESETLPQSKKAKVVEHLSDSMEQAPNDENEIAEEVLESSANFDEIFLEGRGEKVEGVVDGDGNNLAAVASTSPFHSPGPALAFCLTPPPPPPTDASPQNQYAHSSATSLSSTAKPSPQSTSHPSTSKSLLEDPRLLTEESSENIADSFPQPLPIQVPPKTVEVEHALKVRNLEKLVVPPSSSEQGSIVSDPQVDPTEVAAMLARLEEINMKKLKHEMKKQVELAMKKYLHTTNPEVYGQKSWEIFDTLDFAEVCRALAVRSREAVSEKWNLQHGSLEGVELSDEDISQMRDSVDFYFHMRKELGLRLSTCISLEDPAYLTEMHQVAALLFSLLPTLDCKPTSLTFDFYLKIRKNVEHQLVRGGVDGELLQRSLWFFRHLIESHVHFNPGTEPTLSDDNRLFIRDEMLRLKATR